MLNDLAPHGRLFGNSKGWGGAGGAEEDTKGYCKFLRKVL